MARALVVASAQSLTRTTTPVASGPFTISAWIKPTTAATGAGQYLAHFGQVSTGHYYELTLDSTGHIRAAQWDGATYGSAVTTATASDGAWAHVSGAFGSGASRSVFLNGANKVTDSTATGNSSIGDKLNVGKFDVGTPSNYFGGAIAEIGVWDVVLSDEEIAALGKGVSPLLIRPTSLKVYWPILDSAQPDVDRWNSRFDLTPNNSPTMADHPPVYSPYAQWIGHEPPAAAVGQGRMFLVFS